MNIPLALLLLDIAIALTMAFLAYRKIRVPGAISLMILSLSLILWSAAYLVYDLHPDLGPVTILSALLLFSITIAASAQLTFSLSYTNHPNWLTRSVLLLLAVMPVTTQVLLWVKPWHDIFFKSSGLLNESEVFLSLWGKVNTIYIYNLILAGVLLLLDTYIRKPRSLFLRSWSILIGALAPLLVQLFNLLGLNPFPRDIFSLFAFTLTGLGFAYGLFNRQLVETIPVTRDGIVEGMEDGWIVLDSNNIIIDINPSAERIVGVSREKAYGQPITNILSDLPNLRQAFDGNQELEMKRSLKSQQGWRYLNIRLSSIKSFDGRNSGHLIVWRDITERRLVEDARQRARDEMFVLLNAISSAASNALNLDDFLSESIYHIIYPFRSQIVGVFLIDERKADDDEAKLFLASHFGFPTEALSEMTHLPMTGPLFDWVSSNRQSLLVEDLPNDPRIPLPMRSIAVSCILILPLVTQAGEDSKFIGFICLARKEGPVYSPDEIVRLSTLSDHIATLIDSDRRRKLAITLSERQRLLRDLHDSVSQKLYGLVTLTEAAQAALEAGTSVNPAHVLARIGENARQAVKEMRLFLYQMQPIDVEKDGLVSVLHHRLAAVEGRADIKARLLADENVNLSKEKEIALYFIAQEALNNVLRHAHAKSISVTLKQGRSNVILEITDDGCGFDPKKVDRHGLGLRNMKERALQADGKIRIQSKPDEGTHIIISVRRDQTKKSSKRGKPS